MDRLSTNILIIGKSGTGKSSLLNYMFGKELHKTGSGAPETKKGVFPEDYMYGEDFVMHIYDTWGLEAGKDEEWEKLIYDEVNKHEKKTVREWFSTVIMCLSANAQRLELYEKKVIERLLNEWKTKVTVVITHCKTKDDERAKALRDELLTLINSNTIKQEDVIFVNSVAKQLIGQKNKTATFGRSRVFTSIIRNLWETFGTKVPFKVRKYVDTAFDEKMEDFKGRIIDKRMIFRKVSAMEEIEKNINDEYGKFITDTVGQINLRFKEAADYYYMLSKTYARIGLEIDVDEFTTRNLKFNAFDKFESEIRAVFEGFFEINEAIGPNVSNEPFIKLLAEFKAYLSSKRHIRNELIHGVTKYMDQAKRNLNREISKVEARIAALGGVNGTENLNFMVSK